MSGHFDSGKVCEDFPIEDTLTNPKKTRPAGLSSASIKPRVEVLIQYLHMLFWCFMYF